MCKELIEEGCAKGYAKGRLKVLIDLLKDGLITEEIVISKSGISREELKKRLDT